MKRLVLIVGGAGATPAMKTGSADVALRLDRQLAWSPPPSAAETVAFFAAPADQERHFHWHDYSPAWLPENAGAKGLALMECFEECEQVALWVDPAPGAQLLLMWLLDYLRGHKEHMSRLTLVQWNSPISSHSAEELARSQAPAVKILDEHLDLASVAWRAYCAPTPTAWRDLLDRDLVLLPQLRQTAVEMLEELPSSTTGLGATETRMLELISEGRATPSQLFSDQRRRVFDDREIGAVLDGLARCPAPAVSGLNEGPFLEVYRHRERFERYKQSRLSLTALGKAILAGTEDFTRQNPIHRWWGGTELTNDRLWRWDATSQSLIAP